MCFTSVLLVCGHQGMQTCEPGFFKPGLTDLMAINPVGPAVDE